MAKEEKIELFFKKFEQAGIDKWNNNKEFLLFHSRLFKDDDYLNYIGGYKYQKEQNTDYDNDENTLFDDSFTKLFTIALAYECETLGLDLNVPVKVLNTDYDLGDFSINDLMILCGYVAPNNRINDPKSPEESYQKITDTKSDIIAMIIVETLVKFLNSTKNENYNLCQIFDYKKIKNNLIELLKTKDSEYEIYQLLEVNSLKLFDHIDENTKEVAKWQKKKK